MSIDLDRLFAGLLPVVGKSALDDSEIGDCFRQIVGSLVRFDHIVVFAYREEERPIDLYNTFNAEEHMLYVTLYQDGPYLLDPFYGAAREGRFGLLRMRELAPDRFFSSEYYRSYYVQTGLAEEIGYFIPIGQGITVVLSLMRKEATGVFPAREFALVKKTEALVAKLVRSSWSDLPSRFDRQQIELQSGQSRSRKGKGTKGVWDALNLTSREAAIVELVLQGHSSESIGLRLKISTGTVKVHRRNVYRKLGISSQTQLLALYMNFARSARTSSHAGI